MDRDKRLIGLFVRELNLWAGSSFVVVVWPDVETRDKKAIDAVACDTSGRQLAIEHTLLQPFLGERADSVPFLKTAGCLDRRADLAEANCMIELTFKVGAVPKGVDWVRVGQRLEEWFLSSRPGFVEGCKVYEIDGLPFDLAVTIDKSSLPGSPGKVLVMREMPTEKVEPVLRNALKAKLPKLTAVVADERILLLELGSPVRSNREVGEAINSMRADFSELSEVSSAWIARTVAWESEDYIGFHLIWPLDRALEHQEWRKLRP